MMGAQKIAPSTASTGAVSPAGENAACNCGRYIQPSSSPISIQATANTVAMVYVVRAGRRCSVRRICPIDSRSSLAGRRNKPCSSGLRTSSLNSSLAGELDLTVRQGGSENAGSENGGSETACSSEAVVSISGGDGASDWGPGGVSRMESASWMADNAASVGSLIFFGVFAMSVVASYLRWTRAAAGMRASPHHKRVPPEIAVGSPLGQPGSHAPHSPSTAARLSYRL